MNLAKDLSIMDSMTTPESCEPSGEQLCHKIIPEPVSFDSHVRFIIIYNIAQTLGLCPRKTGDRGTPVADGCDDHLQEESGA